MADTRKKYAIGVAIPGFQAGQGRLNQKKQTPVSVGTVHYRMHATIESTSNSGKWNRMVNGFHVSVYEGDTRRNGCHWAYSSAGDHFVCKGWERRILTGWDPIVVAKAGLIAKNLKSTFGSTGIDAAVSSVKR
jgi:hypothetical protein